MERFLVNRFYNKKINKCWFNYFNVRLFPRNAVKQRREKREYYYRVAAGTEGEFMANASPPMVRSLGEGETSPW